MTVPRFLRQLSFPPSSATVETVFGAQSCRGKSREINEDHYMVLRLGRHQEMLMTSLRDESIADRFEESGYAMVVADGMGGSGSGEAASRVAVTTLVYMIRYFGKWNLRVDETTARDIMARAERFYRHVDVAVAEQWRRTRVRTESTLTAIFGSGRDLFLAHVGHSRAYLLRKKQLMRLTRDHTLDQQWKGKLPAAPLMDVSLRARDLRHVLTNTIGMSGPAGPRVDLERIRLDDGDRVLVCTNGLTDTVDEETIGRALGTDEAPDAQCQALVSLAQAGGGEDDVTALIAHFRIPPG